jgi:hypothetical protein
MIIEARSSRDGLQREYLTSLLWTDGDTVANQAAQYLPHWIFVLIFQAQVTFSSSVPGCLPASKIQQSGG